ncbi:MAG: M20/M25/M40 family metallo-hydrolase [Gemmatimonadetes bacterium]|nr:M20/M25/M40 family metallo-hydrolase [Gemmatimonadota bacterium]
MWKPVSVAVLTAPLVLAAPAGAQTFPTDDAVIRRIWEEGMTQRSQVLDLSQALMDSIGPRLQGAPSYDAAADWIASRYAAWGIESERHVYGTWLGWDRGHTHIDLISPRKRTLSGMMLAWSRGTDGPVEADVIMLPRFASRAELDAWLPQVRGRMVAITLPEPTCREDRSWQDHARPASLARLQEERARARSEWTASLRAIGQDFIARIEDAGAVAVFEGLWSGGWGVDKIFDASTTRIPGIHLSCEDYGLVARLAERGQSPRIRLDARADFLGDVPAYNVIGRIPGTERPNEYVLLSAHLDSWDGASGATDNGTGTVMMMEAMRLLRAAVPNPRRTILVGHWGGEEQGLIGSAAYAADHPDVMRGLNAAFNQDNGTWRVDFIRMMGFTAAGGHFARWFSAMPNELTDPIELDVPGLPESSGSDHMSFLCVPAPAFRLQSNYPDYRTYTWHTNLDTFDKVVLDDLRHNATLAAMLAYLASEDPELMSRETRELPAGPSPQAAPTRRTMAASATGAWPACRAPRRSM